MLNFNYAGCSFQGIGDGYRVACMMKPDGNLMGDNFYVYLSIRRELEEDGSVQLEHIQSSPVGVLELEGSGPAKTGIKHKFNDIRLKSVLFQGDHRSKSRMLEFQYNQDVILNAEDDAVVLDNDWTSACKSGRLSHRLTVGDREDSLLGLAFRQTATGNSILRLQWYANEGNSILAEVYKRRGGWGEALNLTLSGETINVTQDNLSRIMVEQTWGRFSNTQPLSFAEMINADGVRSFFHPSSAGDVLRSERGDDDLSDVRGIDGGIVETATFIFQDTAYSDLKLT